MNKANELSTMPLNLKTFHFDKARRTLSAEASDFGPCKDGTWWLGRLYNDACDEGITIKSHLTGKEERFALAEVATREGDLLYWRFVPLAPLANVDSVTIYND